MADLRAPLLVHLLGPTVKICLCVRQTCISIANRLCVCVVCVVSVYVVVVCVVIVCASSKLYCGHGYSYPAFR